MTQDPGTFDFARNELVRRVHGRPLKLPSD